MIFFPRILLSSRSRIGCVIDDRVGTREGRGDRDSGESRGRPNASGAWREVGRAHTLGRSWRAAALSGWSWFCKDTTSERKDTNTSERKYYRGKLRRYICKKSGTLYHWPVSRKPVRLYVGEVCGMCLWNCTQLVVQEHFFIACKYCLR